eukprot:gene11998-25140_t
MICGKAGSGKTSLLINALIAKKKNRVYRKVFDKIILVMPSNSRKSLKNNPLDDLPEDQQFENFDDVTAYLKDNPKQLIELATNRRHLKLSIVLLVQFIRAVPRPVRFQVTHVTFFKPANELDLKICI